MRCRAKPGYSRGARRYRRVLDAFDFALFARYANPDIQSLPRERALRRVKLLCAGFSFIVALWQYSASGMHRLLLAHIRLWRRQTLLVRLCSYQGINSKTKNRPRGSVSCFGSGTRIRTQTYRVRVCCATFTQFRYIKLWLRCRAKLGYSRGARRYRRVLDAFDFALFARYANPDIQSLPLAIYRRGRYAELLCYASLLCKLLTLIPLSVAFVAVYILAYPFLFVKRVFVFSAKKQIPYINCVTKIIKCARYR